MSRSIAFSATLSRPLARSASMQRPNAPTPGRTTAAAPSASIGVGDQPGVASDVLEGLFGRAEIADAVVEDGDHASIPLVEGTPPPSMRTASRRARATP